MLLSWSSKPKDKWKIRMAKKYRISLSSPSQGRNYSYLIKFTIRLILRKTSKTPFKVTVAVFSAKTVIF